MNAILIFALQAIQASAVPNPPVVELNEFSGRQNQTVATVLRADAEIRVDGVFNEPVWQQATVLRDFSQYRPVEGRPAEDSTRVLVWYTSDAIYFGIQAFAPPGATRAKLAERDKIDADDFVQILLDTFNDKRQAFVFGVNPLGVQSDGIRSEGSGGATANNVDVSPDYVFESKGKLTDFGYQVEVRIPFKSLRFQSSHVQDWGINIFRNIQHSGFEDTWTRTGKAASFLAQGGTLRGLTELHRGLVLELNPVTTTRLEGANRIPGDGWNYDGSPEVGGNVRWGITSNVTLNGTIKPDFSQVEADAGQVASDARFALSFPERRPFFVEGIEQFTTPNNIIYTRRIASPVGAAKVTGKMAGVTIAMLSAVDDQSLSATGSRNPLFNIIRLRRDLGKQSTLGGTYTDRIDGSDFNRVANVDARIVFRKIYFVQMQYAQSFTRAATSDINGPLWQAWYDRTGKYWGFGYNILGISPTFRAASGFVQRTGVVVPRFMNRFSVYGKRGGFMQAWNISPSVNWTFGYDEFLDGRGPREWKSSMSNAFTLRGGWAFTVNPIYERFHFDRNFHATYYVQSTNGSFVPFVRDNVAEARAVSFALTTPQFPRFWSTLKIIPGKDADFYEHATADITSISWTGDWKPTRQLRVQGMYTHLAHRRERDGTLIDRARIPRLKVEYQLSRPLFVRLVGQYDARTRSTLRDPVTDNPIFTKSSTGSYAVLPATAGNDFRLDWLFSYRPNPGTVFFLGYGSSLTETSSFRFQELNRVNDAFFVKLSYVFRL